METFVDPIHSLIAIDAKDEDCMRALNEPLERLKGLRQLGWVAIAFPGATHTKYEHALGTFHLARLATEGRKIRGIDSHSLRMASLSHVIGNTAYSYPVARGILMAIDKSAEVKRALRKRIDGVAQRLKDLEGASKTDWRSLGSDLDTQMIQKWLCVEKLVNVIPDRDGGRLAADIARFSLDQTQLAYHLIDIFHTLDYVLRDLYYTGIANLRLNYDLLLESIQRVTDVQELRSALSNTPEWAVVESIKELLVRQAYWDAKVLSAEAMFSKIVAKSLIDNTIGIEVLLTEDDKGLSDRLIPSDAGRLFRFEEVLRRPYSVVFSADHELYFGGDESWALAEQRVAIRANLDPIEYTLESGTILVLETFSRREIPRLRTRVLWNEKSRTLGPLFRILAELEGLLGVDLGGFGPPSHQRFGEGAIRALLSRYHSISFGNKAMEGLSLYLQENHEEIRKLLPTAVKKKAIDDEFVLIGRGHDELTEAMRSLPFEIAYMTRPRVARRMLLAFGYYLVSNFDSFKVQFIKRLLKGMADSLDTEARSEIAEAAILLRELLSASNDGLVWSLPNVQCFDSKGEIVHEINVISVILGEGDDYPKVRMAECTVDPGASKTISDAQKLAELTTELSGRFKDLQVSTTVYGGDPGVDFSDLGKALR